MALRTFTDRRRLRDGIRNADLDFNFSELEEANVKPDEPIAIGYGAITAGVLTASSSNITSIVTGAVAPYAQFDFVTVDTNPSADTIYTAAIVGVGAFAAPLVAGSVTRLTSTKIRLTVLQSNITTTVAANCTFSFILYKLPV
tara:strand:- start:790 stop:1218 length:429 start_codon:yes stop_codon:yes gene_type:complete